MSQMLSGSEEKERKKQIEKQTNTSTLYLQSKLRFLMKITKDFFSFFFCFYLALPCTLKITESHKQKYMQEHGNIYTRTQQAHFAHHFVRSLIHQLKRKLHNRNLHYYLFIKFYAKLTKSSQHKYTYKCVSLFCFASLYSTPLPFLSRFRAATIAPMIRWLLYSKPSFYVVYVRISKMSSPSFWHFSALARSHHPLCILWLCALMSTQIECKNVG